MEKTENIKVITFGAQATGKQNSSIGEIDYEPVYDEVYLNNLRSKAKKSWLTQVNADEWLREIRGTYEG